MRVKRIITIFEYEDHLYGATEVQIEDVFGVGFASVLEAGDATDVLRFVCTAIEPNPVVHRGRAPKVEIDELGLPARVRNALVRANMDTVGDVISHTRLELMSIPNFGQVCADALEFELLRRGFQLKDA